jgi:hypothetical protein
MSQARPMDTQRRVTAYLKQTGHDVLTPRQARQVDRKAARTYHRQTGQLRPHGATGIRTRRPLARSQAGRRAAA